MAMTIYRLRITLLEHVFFASREVGNRFETEPVLGNYALAYALGLCQAPYYVSGPPRYREDLGPLNAQGIYVTPGTFDPATLRFVFSQFNGQTDTFYFRFDQNAIGTVPGKKARAANFPQNGKIRLLGLGSVATCYLLDQAGAADPPPYLREYIRLGKFNSKARVVWEPLRLTQLQPVAGDHAVEMALNAVDLPPDLLAGLRAFSLYNIYPAPLISQCRLEGAFWECADRRGGTIRLPAGMRFGVEGL